MRGVTSALAKLFNPIKISTHTPHARRDKKLSLLMKKWQISTHTPHARRDLKRWHGNMMCRFLLTRLMRGVTGAIGVYEVEMQISTHTPHARRDSFLLYQFRQTLISTHTPHARRDCIPVYLYTLLHNFYSHASCEAWRWSKRNWRQVSRFLLTRLMRGVTDLEDWIERKGLISTHTPHARRDFRNWIANTGILYFYSHASCEAWRVFFIIHY